jgi:hypothetical protein
MVPRRPLPTSQPASLGLWCVVVEIDFCQFLPRRKNNEGHVMKKELPSKIFSLQYWII